MKGEVQVALCSFPKANSPLHFTAIKRDYWMCYAKIWTANESDDMARERSLREIENIIEVNYGEFKDAWERHRSG
jgi:hypothetical protein